MTAAEVVEKETSSPNKKGFFGKNGSSKNNNKEQEPKKDPNKKEKKEKAERRGSDSSTTSTSTGDKNNNKNWLGQEVKRPRAEYQAEIDELKLKLAAAESDLLTTTSQLTQFKDWARQAPSAY